MHDFPYDTQDLLIQVDAFGYSDKTVNFSFPETGLRSPVTRVGPFQDSEFSVFDSSLWDLVSIDADAVLFLIITIYSTQPVLHTLLQ